MDLTIGMATFRDFDGVYFTLQSLRLYQDLENVELLVVDNHGCAATRDLVENGIGGRYVLFTDVMGTAAPRERVFREARGEAVLCLDSHVLLPPGTVARLKRYYRDNPHSQDLLQGPLLYDDHQTLATHFEPVWRESMWGTWAYDDRAEDPEAEPFEIPMQGLGLFSCRRAVWPGFHPQFRGFGGEEGYLHEKFRGRGGRCLCLPWLRWLHRFGRPAGVPYRLNLGDRIFNYLLGHRELGLDERPILEHFSRHPKLLETALAEVDRVLPPTGPRMKLAALCCTYLRPSLLGQLIECFLRQDYPHELRELVILDDAGQYDNQQGDGWRLISLPGRFRTLGEKRNACAALASPDAEGFLVADDDDVYLPHWFRAHAEALRRAEWSRPSRILLLGDSVREHPTGGLYHASWAFRRSAFDRVRGYVAMNNGEDQEFARRLLDAGVSTFDPCTLAEPFFVYREDNGSYHLSGMARDGYEELGRIRPTGKATLRIGWPRDFAQFAVVERPSSGAHPSRAGKRAVELIGRVDGPGRDGPTNGMAALQKALQRRIAEGVDWLTIAPGPSGREVLPWFWHVNHRRAAVEWAARSLPFVTGPNVLFLNSRSPRSDADECALLDAASCRGMFCHSEWYRELIASRRGPANRSPLVLWPYPIDPWPGEPEPDRYDLLIYAKNGDVGSLRQLLSEKFPRHVEIHYGQYRREQLYEAARRSRACAYLADDDHGPLALQEILLAGCPAVGVRTGASLVEQEVTGLLVEQLPVGGGDGEALAAYLRAIEQAQGMDRRAVRAAASEAFDTQRIVNVVLAALEEARQG